MHQQKSSNTVIIQRQYAQNFPGGSDSKASAYNVGHLGSIPGPGRSPGEGNVNPLQYSCLENPMDVRAWQATVHGVAESDTTELSLSLFFVSKTRGGGRKSIRSVKKFDSLSEKLTYKNQQLFYHNSEDKETT